MLQARQADACLRTGEGSPLRVHVLLRPRHGPSRPRHSPSFPSLCSVPTDPSHLYRVVQPVWRYLPRQTSARTSWPRGGPASPPAARPSACPCRGSCSPGSEAVPPRGLLLGRHRRYSSRLRICVNTVAACRGVTCDRVPGIGRGARGGVLGGLRKLFGRGQSPWRHAAATF